METEVALDSLGAVFGRLAQLGEHYLDTVGVTGSSPVSFTGADRLRYGTVKQKAVQRVTAYRAYPGSGQQLAWITTPTRSLPEAVEPGRAHL